MVENRQLTEYEKRLKRAERFGIDPKTVVQPAEHMTEQFDKTEMKKGTQFARVDQLQADIEKIKSRQQRFEKGVEEVKEEEDKEKQEPTKESLVEIKRLERRIGQLENKEQPMDIDTDATVSETKLYLYGTDFMSTTDIKDIYMCRYPEIQINWINDSSCVLIFNTEKEASDAIHGFSVGEPDQIDDKLEWRQALGFEHDKKGWQRLWLRYATDRDTKADDQDGETSRFYKF